MPHNFNALLREAGIALGDVRLVRHQDRRADVGRTPFDLWHNDRPKFESYQSTQGFDGRKRLTAPYWAVFLGTPEKETLFVGIYSVRYLGLLRMDRRSPHILDDVVKAGTCDEYELARQDALSEFIGKLYVDWGEGRGRGRGGERAFVQYASRHDKPILRVLTKSTEE